MKAIETWKVQAGLNCRMRSLITCFLAQLIRMVDQVQGFRLTQHCFFNSCFVFFSITATCFGLMTIFRRKYVMKLLILIEDGHTTETCSGH
jgi:hypothetical protein